MENEFLNLDLDVVNNSQNVTENESSFLNISPTKTKSTMEHLKTMEQVLKRKVVIGYIRRIQINLGKKKMIPPGVVLLILSFIHHHDKFLSQYWKSTVSREIIHIQIGGCGNQIGNAFWNTLTKEHDLKTDGRFSTDLKYAGQNLKEKEGKLDKIHVYFNECGEMRFVPRAVIVEMEPGCLSVQKATPLGALFKPDNMVFGASGAGNNWAKGHYTEGAELIDEIVDVVRRETESCDCPQGFQLTHSLGG
eukprot:96480_1